MDVPHTYLGDSPGLAGPPMLGNGAVPPPARPLAARPLPSVAPYQNAQWALLPCPVDGGRFPAEPGPSIQGPEGNVQHCWVLSHLGGSRPPFLVPWVWCSFAGYRGVTVAVLGSHGCVCLATAPPGHALTLCPVWGRHEATPETSWKSFYWCSLCPSWWECATGLRMTSSCPLQPPSLIAWCWGEDQCLGFLRIQVIIASLTALSSCRCLLFLLQDSQGSSGYSTAGGRGSWTMSPWPHF